MEKLQIGRKDIPPFIKQAVPVQVKNIEDVNGDHRVWRYFQVAGPNFSFDR
jgi:hypothetical protein